MKIATDYVDYVCNEITGFLSSINNNVSDNSHQIRYINSSFCYNLYYKNEYELDINMVNNSRPLKLADCVETIIHILKAVSRFSHIYQVNIQSNIINDVGDINVVYMQFNPENVENGTMDSIISSELHAEDCDYDNETTKTAFACAIKRVTDDTLDYHDDNTHRRLRLRNSDVIYNMCFSEIIAEYGNNAVSILVKPEDTSNVKNRYSITVDNLYNTLDLAINTIITNSIMLKTDCIVIEHMLDVDGSGEEIYSSKIEMYLHFDPNSVIMIEDYEY